MAREVGVKNIYLMKEGYKAWTFTDDYRPEAGGGIDRRYAEYNEFGGMVWFRNHKEFKSAEDGNRFFMDLIDEGFQPCTEDDVRRLTHRAAILTY